MVSAKHAAHGSAFAATAVVHFVSGDVSLPLVRKGGSFKATARTMVSAAEYGGPVLVDATITYGTQTVSATGQGSVNGAVLPPPTEF